MYDIYIYISYKQISIVYLLHDSPTIVRNVSFQIFKFHSKSL